jgi:hypothetical protein
MPVNVTLAPEIVAAPLTTEYVTAPEDAEDALTANGAAPYVGAGIAAKARVGVPAVTLKLVVAVAAAKVPAAAWLASRTTVPTPVSVTVLPETLAGPLVTEYVMAPEDAEDALTTNGAAPNFLAATAVKVSLTATPPETLKVAVAVAAAKFPAAAWLARSSTVPAPVSVTVLPEIVAGPLTTEYVTAPDDAEAALTAKGAAPNAFAGIAAKVSAGTSAATLKLVVALPAA